MEKEFQRLPQREELEKHIKELSKSVDGLNDEIKLVRKKRTHSSNRQMSN